MEKEIEITFTYLYNLHPDSYQKGYFGSDYWADLHQDLSSKNLRSKCLHIYIKNSMTPSASSAAVLLKRLNLNRQSGQTHVSLDSFLSIRTVLGAIRDYVRIRSFGSAAINVFSFFQNKISGFYLFCRT